MSGTQKRPQNLIISIYKETIGIYGNRAIFQKPANEQTIFDRLVKELNFHTGHQIKTGLRLNIMIRYYVYMCWYNVCCIHVIFVSDLTLILQQLNRSITWRNVEGGKNKCRELLSLWETIQLAVTGRGWMCNLHRKTLSPKHVPLLVSVKN